MAADHTALREWGRMSTERAGFIRRLEKYAAFTLPRLMVGDGYNPYSDELRHDWQSVGAQAVNHVVNKLVLTLFAPSRPFVRLELPDEWKVAFLANNPEMEEVDLDEALAAGERKIVRTLDNVEGFRPRLYTLLAHTIVLGNTLLYLPEKRDETPQVISVKRWCLRRTGKGAVRTLIIREEMKFDELEPEVQEAVKKEGDARKYQPTSKVCLFKYIERNHKGGYELTQYVDTCRLPEAFSGAWPNEKALPYRVLTWNREEDSPYGTGLVEDYAGDFATLSSLSEAEVKGAILASEFRWLLNPNGVTRVEQLEDSNNGDVLAGSEGDLSLITSDKSGAVQAVSSVAQARIQRIGQGFLLGSAVTRDAERVTAEEIRMQATELETSFGGAYSRIANELQSPVADWLVHRAAIKLQGTTLEVSIITGLDALSRSGDLDNLRGALQDIAGLGTITPEAKQELDLGAIYSTIFTGHGLPAGKYVKSEARKQQEAQAQQEQAANAAATEAGVKAGADAAAATATQGQ